MITGTITIVLWKELGYSEYLYEIIPAFIFNGVVTFAAEKLFFRVRNTYTARNWFYSKKMNKKIINYFDVQRVKDINTNIKNNILKNGLTSFNII